MNINILLHTILSLSQSHKTSRLIYLSLLFTFFAEDTHTLSQLLYKTTIIRVLAEFKKTDSIAECDFQILI